jgi:hypothetical protein
MQEARDNWASCLVQVLWNPISRFYPIEEFQVHIATAKTSNKPVVIPILIGLLILIVLGAAAYSLVSRQPVPAPRVKITQAELVQKYGLRMDLVAVTAAGGFVDVRIRIVNGEKAKTLLSDKTNFPALAVGSRVVLQASEDVKSQAIKFENDGTMFLMYPNSGGAVKAGTPVGILFGDIAVDPIEAR